MCLTIPGKIIAIDQGIATVKSSRETVQIDLSLVFDVKVGDWILYAGERAVKAITEDDAREIISLLEDHYHPVDVSKLPLRFKKIIYKVRTGKNDLSPADITYLLKLKGRDNLETLYAEANSLRKERLEDFVCIHGIIEFSNYCKNDCLYCGIRKGNKSERYRMDKDEILKSAQAAVSEGYKLLVLQSGEDDFYSDNHLVEIIKSIKKNLRVFIFISVGERSASFYKRAYSAGATGALIRFETSNASLYEEMRPGHRLVDRLDLINKLKKTGYYIATGSIIGLPSQTVEDIAQDLITIKELGVPMISAGPFIPASGTPLAISRPESQVTSAARLELTLKYIAIARLMMPEIKIPVTTALESLDPEEGKHKGLLAGANALMFNLTPEKHQKKYKIYDNKFIDREKVWQKYGLFQGEESYEMLEGKLRL